MIYQYSTSTGKVNPVASASKLSKMTLKSLLARAGAQSFRRIDLSAEYQKNMVFLFFLWYHI